MMLPDNANVFKERRPPPQNKKIVSCPKFNPTSERWLQYFAIRLSFTKIMAYLLAIVSISIAIP